MVERSGSDKLAYALACLGGIVAIILYLVPKTPTVVGVALLAIAALSVYPILHFVSSRILRLLSFISMALLVALLGWWQWPKPAQSTSQSQIQPASAASGPPAPALTSQQPTANQSEQLKPKKSKPRPQVQSNTGSDNTNTQIGTAQGPVAIAPQGIANAAPNYGVQTVTNAPVSRVLNRVQADALRNALQGSSGGTLFIYTAGSDTDVVPLTQQLCRLFHGVSDLAVNCIGVPNGASEGGPPPENVIGLHCYHSTEIIRKALDASGLGCVVETSEPPLQFKTIVPVILVGDASKTSQAIQQNCQQSNCAVNNYGTQSLNIYGAPKLTLNAEHYDVLVSSLSPLRGHMIGVFAHNPTDDTNTLYGQFIQAFKVVGIELDESISGQGTDMPAPAEGISVDIGKDIDPQSFEARTLASALVSAGLAKNPVPAVHSGKGLCVVIAPIH